MDLDNTAGQEVAKAIDRRIINIAQEVYTNSPNDKIKYGIVKSSKAGIFTGTPTINTTYYLYDYSLDA